MSNVTRQFIGISMPLLSAKEALCLSQLNSARISAELQRIHTGFLENLSLIWDRLIREAAEAGKESVKRLLWYNIDENWRRAYPIGR